MFLSVVNQNLLLGLVSKVNSFMWDFLLLILLCGTGVYYSFRTGFIQVRKFGEAFKATFGGISLKGEKAGKDGMSSFQSLATSLAAQVGTGNLAGAATAIAAGGPGAIFGGVVGTTIKQAIRYGVARGLFSNEAGMGSTPNSHALAKVDHPCDQGLVAMIGVFIDTFVILSLTALVILTSGVMEQTPAQGIALTQAAFYATFGQLGTNFIAIIMFFFAFSTIIGWYFFGEQNVRYLFGDKGVRVYTILVILFIVIGSTLKVTLVWDLSDMFNGLMVVPNVLGLLALSGVVVNLLKEYENKKK